MALTTLLLAAQWAGWPAVGLLPLAFAPLVVVAYALRLLRRSQVPEL